MEMLRILLLFLFITSCSPYYYQSKGPKVTHVLALTEEGDTIKIPINQIRPNVVYNVVGYDYYRPYYYNRWNPFNTYYDPHWHPNTYKPKPSYNVNNSNNNVSIPIRPSNSSPNPTISTPPNPAKTNSKRNN